MKKQTKKATQTPTTKPIVTQVGKIPDSLGFSFSKNFAKATALILLLILTLSCNHKKQPIQLTASTERVLVVDIEDYSISATGSQYTDSPDIEQLIHALSRYETTVKLLGIYANSSQQRVFTMHVAQYPDTIAPCETNVYKKARIVNIQKKAYAVYEEKLNQQIAEYTRVALKPRTAPFSDVIHTLELAQRILNEPLYQHHHRVLLFCSDGIHDEPQKRHVRLQPVMLPANTTVIAVRPSLTEEELKSLFPQSTVIVCVDISDAIEMINNF